jgi:hypothetical protein
MADELAATPPPRDDAPPVRPPAEPSARLVAIEDFMVMNATAAEVETMMAFRVLERQAGRHADTVTNYLDRLMAFINSPHG